MKCPNALNVDCDCHEKGKRCAVEPESDTTPINNLERGIGNGLLIMAAVVGACLMFSKCARADDTWTRTNTRAEVAYQLVNAIDFYQTTRIQYRADLVEGEPITRAILGPEPSTRDAAMYFGTLAVSHFLIARALPPKWRAWYQGGTLAYQSFVITRNCVEHSLCLQN